MLLHIIESASGDHLGNVIITGMDDEAILSWLCRNGYLLGSPDLYEISRCFPFAEGETVVIDMDTRLPVLKLELPAESENKAA